MARRDNLVLNVDDNEVARYAKSRALSRATEMEVIEAASGFEALVLVKERRPTLVLLDVKLPDMSGLDVCRIIKQDYPETLVLQTSASFVTGDLSSSQVMTARVRWSPATKPLPMMV